MKESWEDSFFWEDFNKQPVTTARLRRHYRWMLLELIGVSTQHGVIPPLAFEPPKGIFWDRSAHTD